MRRFVVDKLWNVIGQIQNAGKQVEAEEVLFVIADSVIAKLVTPPCTWTQVGMNYESSCDGRFHTIEHENDMFCPGCGGEIKKLTGSTGDERGTVGE